MIAENRALVKSIIKLFHFAPGIDLVYKNITIAVSMKLIGNTHGKTDIDIEPYVRAA